MDRDAEALAHRLRHRGSRPRRVVAALLHHEVHDLVGALVSPLRTAWTGKQRGQATRGERRGRGIERLAADAERAGDLRDRPAIDAMTPKHLVLHLHEVVAIEEHALVNFSCSFRNGGMAPRRTTRREKALKAQGPLRPHPEKVSDPLRG